MMNLTWQKGEYYSCSFYTDKERESRSKDSLYSLAIYPAKDTGWGKLIK